jgi:hypothetical protein
MPRVVGSGQPPITMSVSTGVSRVAGCSIDFRTSQSARSPALATCTSHAANIATTSWQLGPDAGL